MRTRIKFCGIARVEDAIAAAACGVDAIGLVFAPRSVRRVDVALATTIAEALPPFVARVALFMDQQREEIAAVLRALPCALLQFHGAEDDGFCAQFDRPYIKALPMASVDDVATELARFPRASGFLLDAHARGAAGGSGARFDWTRVPRHCARPLILAGGLDPGNVREAIVQARPFAVDVSSGIEASPGIKDHAKMRAFADEVRRADA